MNRIRMRTDLAEEGMSVPAGKSFESYDTLVDVIYLSADDLVDATYGNDPVDTDTHPFCYVKLRDGRCFYMVSADLDFPVKMKVSERFALNQWLSEHPDTMPYDAIIARLKHDFFDWRVEGIVLWEVVEDYPAKVVAEFIEDTRKAFERSADDLCSGIKLSDIMEGACDE